MTDGSVVVLAHGLGGSSDLPIPYTYALIGAAWALTFTFGVVALAWRRPRFDPDKPGRALPQWVTTAVDAPATRWVLAAAGLLFAAWVAMAAMFGTADGNPLPGVFYVLMWVGLVASSLAIGPIWRAVSPVRTVYRLLRLARLRDGRGYPRPLGYWPAAFGLFAFVWLELASPDPGSLGAIKLWLWVYIVVTLTGAIVCGDTLPQHKPDPEPARHACRLLDVATSNSLFVGDSITDVETARAAGCSVVCVRDGYNHGTPAAQLGADAVIDSLIQLL